MKLFIVYYYTLEGDKDFESVVAMDEVGARCAFVDDMRDGFDIDFEEDSIIDVFEITDSHDIDGNQYNIIVEKK